MYDPNGNALPLRSWRYKPAMFEGKPVKVYYTLTVNFQTTSKDCLELRRKPV